MAHDHEHHDHPHASRSDHPVKDWERREAAIRSLLIDKGVLSAEDIRRKIEEWEQKTPAQGARVIARAWVDPPFEARLLEDANAAAEGLGIDARGAKIVALKNTPQRHHLVVCTLCSCYPRALLGLPPAWYKAPAYRSRAVNDPRGVLAEFGTKLSPEVEVRVVDSTADCRYLVVPLRPSGTDGWDEARLASLVTRDSMIGVAPALDPGERHASGHARA
jgi:nitrile hydratase alpha subunit